MYKELIRKMVASVYDMSQTLYNEIDGLECIHYTRYFDILTPKQNLLMFHKKWRVAKKWRRKYDKIYQVRIEREKQLLNALGLYTGSDE